MKEFYRILEVAEHASHDVIHSAYKTLAQKYNDDKVVMQGLNEAKATLLDDAKRKAYDGKLDKLEGKIVGNYRLIKEIAEGGFGRTYLGEHNTLKTPVCVKHTSFISAQDELLLQEEAKSIWDLRHYGIPNIRDIVKLHDGSLALVMSYIPGPTLAQLVEKHSALDAEHVAWISERVLNILRYLHFHGVVHGDVKPQNIIVQPESHSVVLVDYGLSSIRPKSNSGSKGYTPYFAAPEQIQGKTLLPESDLFSLGMTMIFALGGDLEHKLVPSTTPDNLCKFLKKLIVKDVLNRPAWDKNDLITELQEARERDFGRRASSMKPLKY